MSDRATITTAIIIAVFGFLTVRSYAGPTTLVASSQTSVDAVQIIEPAEPILPEGMSPELYRTLVSEGSAWVLSTDDAELQIPASIVRVLEANNAVLRVVDEAAK